MSKGTHRPKLRIDDDGRECSACRTYKPWAEYYPNSNGSHGRQHECKDCHKAAVRRWANGNPGRKASTARAWREANPDKYALGQIVQSAKDLGLDPAVVVAHFRAHSGTCDICGRLPNAGDRRTSRLCIDHDHQTGAFRGLLCASCNIGIGKFQDDTLILAAAIKYLDRAKGAVCQAS